MADIEPMEPLDLTPLALEGTERELLIASILERADAELSRRSEDVSPILVLSRWARPALAAAALLALLAAPVLLRGRGQPEVGSGLSDALAVPAPADAWLSTERAPTIGDVLIAMEGRDDQW